MLCFVLDLRSLSPTLLRDLKQSLLQLANYYATYVPIGQRHKVKPDPLLDRIGLCYVYRNRSSLAEELKVAYCPRGNFSLRDFHHAVNNIPADAFSYERINSGSLGCNVDLKLQSLLHDQLLYSWGGQNKDVTKKVILISSYVVEKLDSLARQALMDAADKCISIEFIFFEQDSSCLLDLPESINNFFKQIGDLENCSFRSYLPDAQIYLRLVKQWFQELKEDIEEPLQARFVFRINLIDTLKQISCNLCPSSNHLIDLLVPSQTCSCHGIPLENYRNETISSCPVTHDQLGTGGIVENSLRVGHHTILFMPSFQCLPKIQQVANPLNFIVVERTHLPSLSEGLIFGASYIVTPTSYESDDMDKSEQNVQVFQVLCSVLSSLDQGLVCFANCNVETETETSFGCYYVLLPSENGLMLLRRLAAAEETFPLPDVSQYVCSLVAKDLEDSVRTSLLKENFFIPILCCQIEVSDYNPIQHERGFHQKLNLLIKESLQFGAIPPKTKEATFWSNSSQQNSLKEESPSMSGSDVTIPEKAAPQLDKETGESASVASIAEEWEQLIVTEFPKIESPICSLKPSLNQQIMCPVQTNKQLDAKTSRILERLEGPRQLKRKVLSPIVCSSTIADHCTPSKKPLIPYKKTSIDPPSMSSQPMKPNFQRIKKKK
ncbi:hypothetical protein Leryth_005187 [Lithospermum erythrorhizon]|nr:hypothetical protein Leryth_005187 [Lithospermum erythrorhizon]